MLLGLFLLLVSFICSFPFLKDKYEQLSSIETFVEKASGVLAIILAFISIWKFFGPDGGKIMADIPTPFIGDLFPSLIGLAVAITVNPKILNILNIKEESKKTFTESLIRVKIPLGFVGMVLGFIHLFAPGLTLF